MSATAFIFARGGPKGVKDKNIYPFAGKPLIAHGIASALAYLAQLLLTHPYKPRAKDSP